MTDQIKIGSVIFEDITTYSKDDKIRDKRSYSANIDGLEIYVSNRKLENKTGFSCEGIGIKYLFFRNENISFEDACKYSLKNVLDKINKIQKELNQSL